MSNSKASVFPPALSRQFAMAAARSSDQGVDQVRPDDSASGVGSQASWSVVPPDAPGTPVQPAQAPEAPPGIDKTVWDQDSDDDVPPANWSAYAAAEGSNAGWAPATEAAKHLLGNKEKQTAKLAQQKARAKARGHKAVRWGQMPVAGAFNPQNYQLPPFIKQLGSGNEERSVLILDARDQRIQSPYQGWLLDEILLNAQSGINILSDRQLVRSPATGYHMNLFYVRAIDGYKLIVVGSMTSYGSVPCARWDSLTGSVLSHPAFQPFRWPIMRDDSSTWVDVKVKIEGYLLLHLELRGYRSDQDMSVQLNYINEGLVMTIKEVLFVPSVAVTIFQGWRVVATSFEVGGRLYVCSEGGVVVALDHPLCHFEVRMTALSSADSIGMDADRLEFRFRTSGDKIDVACSQVMVPSTWLVLSRVSGPTLIQNARWCRDRQARVEGPDQTMQMSQLAGIHAHWTAATEAFTLEETGPRVGAVAVDTHVDNFHLTCESPLFKSEMVIVPKEALALQYHDRGDEQAMIVVPPVAGGPAAIPVEHALGSLKALTGSAGAPAQGDAIVAAESSASESGLTPSAPATGARTLQVQRRSLEARQKENVAVAALPPQAFVAQVDQVLQGLGAQGSTTSVPRSFGPPPVIEEAEESLL
jgi:hypothetical protein